MFISVLHLPLIFLPKYPNLTHYFLGFLLLDCLFVNFWVIVFLFIELIMPGNLIAVWWTLFFINCSHENLNYVNYCAQCGILTWYWIVWKGWGVNVRLKEWIFVRNCREGKRIKSFSNWNWGRDSIMIKKVLIWMIFFFGKSCHYEYSLIPLKSCYHVDMTEKKHKIWRLQDRVDMQKSRSRDHAIVSAPFSKWFLAFIVLLLDSVSLKSE